MKKFFKNAVGHVMTGIGYMLPLIVGASLVVAIPKIIALCMGITSLDPYAETEGFTHILYLIEQVGWTGIGRPTLSWLDSLPTPLPTSLPLALA